MDVSNTADDVNKPTKVSAEASSYKLGGVLLELHADGLKPFSILFENAD